MTSKRAAHQTLTNLTRLAQRRASARIWLERALSGSRFRELVEAALEVTMETGEPLGRILALQVGRSPDAELVGRLNEHWDGDHRQLRSSVGLRETFVVVMQENLKQLEAKTSDLPDFSELASSLGNLGFLLHSLGRHDEALDAARRAVALYRELVGLADVDFREELATSLANLGSLYRNLGRFFEALDPTREAVAIRRQLAEEQPDPFRVDLVTSLNNLGVLLDDLGQYDEAISAMREAIEQCEMGEGCSAEDRVGLARGLNNLASFLHHLERTQEALEAQREAVGHFRDLAAARPDAFQAELANSLQNLGLYSGELGDHQEAIDAANEAVRLQRRLTLVQNTVYLPR